MGDKILAFHKSIWRANSIDIINQKGKTKISYELNLVNQQYIIRIPFEKFSQAVYSALFV